MNVMIFTDKFPETYLDSGISLKHRKLNAKIHDGLGEKPEARILVVDLRSSRTFRKHDSSVVCDIKVISESVIMHVSSFFNLDHLERFVHRYYQTEVPLESFFVGCRNNQVVSVILKETTESIYFI